MPGAVRERAFHAWLRRHLPAGRAGPLPLGEDVAAFPMGRGRYALLTTDALSEGTHFRRESPPEAIGAATIGASLSDLASKGATPRVALLDLLVPRGTPQRWLEQVTRGAQRMSTRFDASIVGGDTKPSAGRTVVGTMVGLSQGRHLPGRRNARRGDVVVTTGVVGRGGVAAQALGRSRASVTELRALLDIEPRVAEGRALATRVHAMTDSSDGLAEAVRLIADASNARIELREHALPWARGLAQFHGAARRSIAFYGGDYELIATLPRRRLGITRRMVARAGGTLTEIGRVTAGRGGWLVPEDGAKPLALGPPGWDPFGRVPVPKAARP